MMTIETLMAKRQLRLRVTNGHRKRVVGKAGTGDTADTLCDKPTYTIVMTRPDSGSPELT